MVLDILIHVVALLILVWFGILLLYRTEKERPSEDKIDEVKEEVSLFTIEHYPISERYYVRYKNEGWLKTKYPSGLYELEDKLVWAKVFYSVQEAKEAIEFFKEQNLKTTVKYIKVD